MLDQQTRSAILRLAQEGHGARPIARALGLSRNTVRRVLNSCSAEVPEPNRSRKATPYLDRIRELYASCKGNVVRVHEELQQEGLSIAYSTLTRFCREHGMRRRVKRAAGRYRFDPGEEMQHDTSQHTVRVGQSRRRLHCASLVLCYSRMLFAQLYPTWNRFWAKVFLTDALLYLTGSARRAMVDNASVIVAHGSGANAVIAPEMEAFAKRFGFVFVAHEPGDANRSGRVERPFHYIENNFYAGRDFESLADVNQQLVAWCNKVNKSVKRKLRTRPIELFAAERPALIPLPIHVPEVYDLHHRKVDVEGCVNLHTNRYSVPEDLISHDVEVRETKDRVCVFVGRKMVAEHQRQEDGARAWCILPEHRRPRGKAPGSRRTRPLPEEGELRAVGPELAALVDALRQRHGGRAARPIRRLHRLFLDYPDGPLRAAIGEALEYGLVDLERIERMILRRIARDVFRLPCPPENEQDKRDG